MNWNQVYRPTTISQLHLDAVREYCQHLLTSPSFPQAFLFTGPKGTGKTSTARIIGAVLNNPANAATVQALLFDQTKPNKPLQEPDTSLPLTQSIIRGQSFLVQELDAASNRGIDDVRALKQSVFTPPASGLVSVYILDEVHMLTTEAFNALLKLLEEPPPHAVFVLATTELHKIPATIVSRCQVLHFYRASTAEISKALDTIVQQEKLSFDADLITYIAEQSDGSFRDSIKLLQMASVQKLNSPDKINTYLGTTNQAAVQSLVESILEKNAAAVVAVFEELRQSSVNEAAFHKSLLVFLHTALTDQITKKQVDSPVPTAAAQYLLQQLSSSELSQASPIPFLRLEVAILELIHKAQQQQTKQSARSPEAKKQQSQSKPSPAPKTTTKSADIKHSVTHSPLNTEPEPAAADREPISTPDSAPSNGMTHSSKGTQVIDPTKLCSEWSQFVQKIAQNNFSLATLLKSAQPQPGEAGELILEVYYSFHQEQLCQPKFQQLLDDHIVEQYGGSLMIRCQIVEQPESSELVQSTEPALEKLAAEALM